MARSKRVVYEVVCPNNREHVFPFAFEIEPGSEKIESPAEAYCPKCEDFVRVTVKGKLSPSKKVLRRFRDD